MASAVAVRLIRPTDLEALRWVIYRSYYEVLVQLYGPEAAAGYEVRSLEFMDLYLRRDAAGCFVAVGPDDTLIGAVFCFVWGQIGWFGSLAVAPEWQGKGVGQALTRQAVDYLTDRQCRRIGLETWPHSALVRHLYGKFGFRPGRSTLKFSRMLPALGAFDSGATWVRQPDRPALAAALSAVAAVTAAQAASRPDEPRLDYGDEVRVPLEAGWADLAIVADNAGEPTGYALCYLRRPGGGPAGALDIRLLGVVPGRRGQAALDRLVAAGDERAHQDGSTGVTVDVNLRHSVAAGLLRERGFQPVYELLRMERALAGFDPMARSTVVDCARWAG